MSTPGGGFLQVTTTTETEQDALRLARQVVEARLAACVQVLGPIHSTYRWKGGVEEAAEWMCLMKTSTATYPHLETYLLAAHPYETPEITATPLLRGSAAYLRWIAAETSSRRGGGDL